MLKILALIAFTAILCYRAKQVSCSVFNVYTVSSHSDQCSKGIPNCHELPFYIQNIPKYFTSNAEFRFLSGTHIIGTSPVSISGISNITFTGYTNDDDTPIIQCTDGSHGFAFYNVLEVTLRLLIIEGCSPTIHDGAVTVTNCDSVTLERIAIRNTTGVGLSVDNANSLELAHCNFSNNGLGISQCSKMNLNLQFSVSITQYGAKDVNYTITNTAFNGNTAENSSQLGGGLSCFTRGSGSAIITLNNNVFRGIKGCFFGGVNILATDYGLAKITVNNSMFIENYRTDNETLIDGGAASLKGGALKIIALVPYYITPPISDIIIAYSTFVGNKAKHCAEVAVHTLTDSFVQVINTRFEAGNHSETHSCQQEQETYGGICIISEVYKSYLHLKLHINDSEFLGNADHGGAGLLVLSDTGLSLVHYNIVIEKSTFQFNAPLVDPDCGLTGAIELQLGYDGTQAHNATITINNCSIKGNKHGYGVYIHPHDTTIDFGAFLSLLQVFFYMHDSVFQGNAMGLRIVSGKQHRYQQITLENTQFMDHVAEGDELKLTASVIEIQCFSRTTMVWFTSITMINNMMTPIHIIDCVLKFYGYSVIENNTAIEGGGIRISGTGYASMIPLSTLIFKDNTATRGGALYSDSKMFARYDSFCTFLSLLEFANFYNNSASIAGDNMYGGLLRGCTYYAVQWYLSALTNSINNNCSDLSPFRDQSNNLLLQSLSSVSSDPFSVYQCNHEHNILFDERTVTIWSLYPGDNVNIPVTTAGLCNGLSPAFLKVSTSTPGVGIMENDVQGQEIDHPCRTFSFKPLLPYTNTTVEMTINIATASRLPYTVPLNVIIHVQSCPLGMFLESESKACQCNSSIVQYIEQCNVSHAPNPFMKTASYNNWMAYNERRQCISIAPICPFDYCSLSADIYFNLDNTTDYQCSNNRTGTLCGQCQPDLSLMLGSNKCGHCSNYYLLLLLVFSIAGILLIIIIIFLNITISMGMLNGLLFYANIVKLNETQLFPNGSIPVISQFISWLNLDFGIESCFFDGLDGYWKTWLQFAFPLYLWLVTIGIIQYSKYSIKFSRYLPTNIISVLATLIHISFTKLLRTVTDVFMATRLHCGTRTELVWSVDGSIEYWNIRHSLLMVFAVIILVFVAVYTFLLLFFRHLQRASNNKFCCCLRYVFLQINIHAFTDAHSGPFVPSFGHWIGVLVLIRIIVTVVFAYTSGSVDYINNYIIVIIQIAISNVFHSGFYQSKLNFYCEKFFHINLCAVCLVNALVSGRITQSNVAIATMASVALSILVFIAIVVWHFHKVWNKRCGRKSSSRDLQLQPLAQEADENDESQYSPSITIHRRESLIFDFD